MNRTTTVTSFTGGSYYLIEVIAFIIKHLKEKLLVDQLKEVYKSTDFDWVITVPAIWKARAKRMMREAAYMVGNYFLNTYFYTFFVQAGLTSDSVGITKFTPNGIAVPRPEEVNPDKLSLALEPEVAAIYAQHYSSVVGPPPERYMVVDIGGGTVDITVHDNSSGRVSVILPPMGNTWGGITINEALSMLLEDIVGDKQFFKFLRQEKEVAHLAITQLCYQEFEDEKKRFSERFTRAASREVVITLPQAFRNYYMPAKLHEGAMKQGMEYNETDGTLRMSYSLVEQKIFQFTVDGILECVRAAFRELTNKINTVYLVGGFGGCKFVRQKIEEAIGGNFSTLYDNVVCPQLSDLAVVHGAVMWRKDPTIIQSRAADATYGISVGPVFNPSVHDEHYKYFNEEGRLHCSSIFKVFVLKGEMVKDEIYNTTVVPRHQRMTRKSISIYSTTDDGVQYVVDKEGKSTVYKIGQLVLDVPNPDNVPRKDRKIDVFMDFSGTEIKARAQYRITGEEVKTFCDFLSNQD